jgi:hypothetical protein
MKKNLKNFLGVAHIGVGAAVLGVLVCASTSRADVILDNTADASIGPVINTVGQVFNMTTAAGDIASLTLLLSGTGNGEAYVYTTLGGAPNTQLYDLGSVSQASSTITIGTPASYPLSGGTAYAIVYKPLASQLGWSYTTDPTVNTSGGATMGEMFNGAGFTPISGDYLQMSLSVTPVPEVPVTGAVMGFGVLALAIGKTLRRKVSA